MNNPHVIQLRRPETEHVLNIPLYTKSTLYEMFGMTPDVPEAREAIQDDILDWAGEYAPDSVLSTVLTRLETLNNLSLPGWDPCDLTSVRLVCLDERYTNWLDSREEEDRGDSAENRARYMQAFTDEECLTLLRQQRMDYICSLAIIPVMTFFNKGVPKKPTRFVLNDAAKNAITKFIKENVFQDCDVAIPGYIMTMEEAWSEKERLEEMCRQYAATGNIIRCGQFEEQRWGDEKDLVRMAVVPLFLKRELKSAKISIPDVFKMKLMVDGAAMTLYNSSGEPLTPDWMTSEADRLLNACMPGCLPSAIPTTRPLETLPDMFEEMGAVIEYTGKS